MEQYVQAFKEYVLNFLLDKAKEYKMPINKVALGFYLGLADDQSLGAGYLTAKNVIKRYVIKTIFDGTAYYFEAKYDDAAKKYNYDWAAKLSNDVANYDTKEKAQEVIAAFGFKEAEVVYAGDFTEFDKWVETFPNQPKVVDEPFSILQDDITIDDIVKVKLVDFLNKRGKFHAIIMQSLVYISQEKGIDELKTKVYALPDESGKDLTLYIFNDDKYVEWIDINDLVMGAFLAQPPQS